MLLSPRVLDRESLLSAVRLAWASRLMATYWPARGRHDLRLAYARVLLETLELPDATAVRVLEWACRLGGSDRDGIADARQAVESTRKRLNADRERLKAALEQRMKEWKRELRAEPQVARLVLRRLLSPIRLHNATERPDFVEWVAEPSVGLLDGLAPPIWLASPGENSDLFRRRGRFARAA